MPPYGVTLGTKVTLGSYVIKSYFKQVSFLKMCFLCDHRINFFPLTLNKMNLSIVYFAIQKSIERIVYLFPSTTLKQCYLAVLVHLI